MVARVSGAVRPRARSRTRSRRSGPIESTVGACRDDALREPGGIGPTVDALEYRTPLTKDRLGDRPRSCAMFLGGRVVRVVRTRPVRAPVSRTPPPPWGS